MYWKLPVFPDLYLAFIVIFIIIGIGAFFTRKNAEKQMKNIADYLGLNFKINPLKIWVESKQEGLTIWTSFWDPDCIIIHIKFKKTIPFSFYIYPEIKGFIPKTERGYKSGRPIGTKKIKHPAVQGVRVYCKKDKLDRGKYILDEIAEELNHLKEVLKDNMFHITRTGIKIFLEFSNNDLQYIKTICDICISISKKSRNFPVY
jgi:hypothetical protein